MVTFVKLTVDFFNRASKDEQWSMQLGGSLADGLAQRLATATRTPVEYSHVFGSVSVGKTGLSQEQLVFAEPLAAVSVGLAMGVV